MKNIYPPYITKSSNYQIIKLVFAFIVTLSNCLIVELNAQTLSPKVIASAGSYASNASGSLSFTIGEANTQTFSNATNMLTQGFQQPFKATLNLKAYLQGYYINAGLMQNVLYNEGITALPGTECDTIQILLREPTSPYNIVSTSKQVIQTNGTVTFSGTVPAGQSYYIVIKHRNTVETWSTNPVLLNENTTYDFSTAANKAFGDNQVQVGTNQWAFYSGDLNQDENVDLLDLSTLETDINNFQFGYFATDLNGDGNVDLLDSPLLEININNFVFASHP